MDLRTERYTPTRKQARERSSVWRYITAATIVLLLHATGAGTTELRAQVSDIMYIGDLNGDCLSDTVRSKEYGGGEQERSELPTQIFWGISPNGTPPPCTNASVHVGGTTPHVAVTHLLYPTTWASLGGSASFLRYNKNDGIVDMVLFLWGEVPVSQGGSSPQGGEPSSGGTPTLQPVSRAVVLFGGTGMDALTVLPIEALSYPFSSTPVVSMDLRVGTELVEPRVRDYTGIESHELLPVAFLPQQGAPPIPETPPSSADIRSAQYSVSIYPNPTELMARLQSAPLEAGSYSIVVATVNGMEVRRQLVELPVGGELQQELLLAGLPSGMYMVRLYKSGMIVSSQPMMVVR